jgi:hypothetical protein
MSKDNTTETMEKEDEEKNKDILTGVTVWGQSELKCDDKELQALGYPVDKSKTARLMTKRMSTGDGKHTEYPNRSGFRKRDRTSQGTNIMSIEDNHIYV